MIRIIVFAVLAVVVIAGIGVAVFPLSMAASFLASNMPGFSYETASGSVWSGKLTKLVYRNQPLGDVAFSLQPLRLFGGKLGAKVKLENSALTLDGAFAYGLFDHGGELDAVTLSGRTQQISSFPMGLKMVDGDFKFQLDKVVLSKAGCVSAKGTAWTNLLAKGAQQLKWAGPELSGPITCENGQFRAVAQGRTPAGDAAEARIAMSTDLKGEVQAVAQPAQPLEEANMRQAGFQMTAPNRFEQTISFGR